MATKVQDVKVKLSLKGAEGKFIVVLFYQDSEIAFVPRFVL
jgi:hypothetical protein